jgi:hypothetical protein
VAGEAHCDKQLDIMHGVRGAEAAGVGCPSSRECGWTTPQWFTFFALRIPFTRMWTIWTTRPKRKFGADSNE